MFKKIIRGFKKKIVKTAGDEIRDNFAILLDVDLEINDNPQFQAVISLVIFDETILHKAFRIGFNDLVKITAKDVVSLKNKAKK